MDKFHAKVRKLAIIFAAVSMMLVVGRKVGMVRAQSISGSSLPDSELIAQFRQVEAASVSE